MLFPRRMARVCFFLSVILTTARAPAFPPDAWPWTHPLNSGTYLEEVLENNLEFEKKDTDDSDLMVGGWVFKNWWVRNRRGKLSRIAQYSTIATRKGATLRIFDDAGTQILVLNITADRPTSGGNNGLFPTDPTTDHTRTNYTFGTARASATVGSWEPIDTYTRSTLLARGDYLQTRADGRVIEPPRKVLPREIMDSFQRNVRRTLDEVTR